MGLQNARTDASPGRVAQRRFPFDPRALRAAVEQRLDDLSSQPVGANGLDEAVRYSLLAPGKRLRPLLTLLAVRELGGDELAALDAGCALEMVHAASLVLDDLPCMDDAPTRRGQPSTHAAFGQDVAVLASITLLSRAFATAASGADQTPEQRGRLVAILAEAVGSEGLAGGQYRDLKGADFYRAIGSISDGNHRKTGALFVAAIDMAGVIAGATPERVADLRRFATHLGQAFQIMDDLQDGATGAGGQSEDTGKITVLSFLDREGASRRLESHLRQARSALRPGGDLAMFAEEVFDTHRHLQPSSGQPFQVQA